jgi:hypothetical protein
MFDQRRRGHAAHWEGGGDEGYATERLEAVDGRLVALGDTPAPTTKEVSILLVSTKGALPDRRPRSPGA